jgi:predicted lipoprotein with Yx(FWY)xxD motif
MKQTNGHHEAGRRRSGARIATAALAIGGLSASFFAAGIAGAATGSSVVISTSKSAKLGTILVSGTTLYTLKASKTACTAQCLTFWPAVMLPKGMTKATAGKGVNAAKLGTVKRAGGALQVTYGGKALYLFTGDKAAGQVNGNITDTWGKWSSIVTAKPAPSASGSGVTATTSPSSGGAAF